MDIASKILKKQKHAYVSLMIRGLALGLLGGFVGFKLLTEGLGTSAENPTGRAAALTNLVEKIFGEGADTDQIMVYVLAGLMVIVVIAGIYYFIKGAYHMRSKLTPMGQSVVLQAKGHEKFSDTLAAIDADMNRESTAFEKVYISREWILGTEAMRIPNIRGVFWMDQSEMDLVLACVDEAQNIWAASFAYQDQRENAIEYFKTRYPELVYGDKEAYISFLRNEPGMTQAKEMEKEIEKGIEKEKEMPDQIPALSHLTKFRYIRTDGIPTSNFTNQEILDAFEHLAEGDKITLCPMDSLVEEISFVKSPSGLWETHITYLQRGKETQKVLQRGESETKEALEGLLMNKILN